MMRRKRRTMTRTMSVMMTTIIGIKLIVIAS